MENKKKRNKIRNYTNTILLFVIIVAIIVAGVFYCSHRYQSWKTNHENGNVFSGEDSFVKELFHTGHTDASYDSVEEETAAPVVDHSLNAWLAQGSIYTFLQGPRAWSTQATWSGDWCQYDVDGNTFGGFGCGFCCVANIYSSLTPYTAGPLDTYYFATDYTNYQATASVGALDWDYMNQILGMMGFTTELCQKPDSYDEFKWQVGISPTMVVLVSSKEDDSFWKSTSGHYVNIWSYDPTDDTVMVAEPGSPENNRSRIPLSYVYNALKTTSSYQYLKVVDYEEDANQWKHDGISSNWVAPQ